ncbi:hypothetical protein EPUS_04786 [Endocarpon pusillum Z07020]|uniref:Mid2 domain-containing protein n=1 Tax=Endocarpon pusillum (strain Z07020 / HMAS-L-300199) TaxID=1263415 RepID=U1GKL0_ENDPU|nr:uncharacterized protein EPUS_04786 [Endocarpon pusillum Z07020]ERF72733.1 hypothetical protein EPUS_04786 [Endocarpon pusillum Z07020]
MTTLSLTTSSNTAGDSIPTSSQVPTIALTLTTSTSASSANFSRASGTVTDSTSHNRVAIGAGVGVGVLVMLAILGALYYFWRRRSMTVQNRISAQNDGYSKPEMDASNSHSVLDRRRTELETTGEVFEMPTKNSVREAVDRSHN